MKKSRRFTYEISRMSKTDLFDRFDFVKSNVKINRKCYSSTISRTTFALLWHIRFRS